MINDIDSETKKRKERRREELLTSCFSIVAMISA
jgi:hypothetical protein